MTTQALQEHRQKHIEFIRRSTKDPALAAKKIADYRKACYQRKMGFKEFE